jgi:hypothetical protein
LRSAPAPAAFSALHSGEADPVDTIQAADVQKICWYAQSYARSSTANAIQYAKNTCGIFMKYTEQLDSGIKKVASFFALWNEHTPFGVSVQNVPLEPPQIWDTPQDLLVSNFAGLSLSIRI